MGVALSRSPQSLPMKKSLCSFFHSFVVAMVDTTRDAFDNIGTVGTVIFLLDAVAKVVSARDALENNENLHEDVDGQLTSTRDAFVIVAPLKDVVHIVT